MDKFQENLIKNCGFIKGQKVLVALSGGADSVALLHMMDSLKIEVFAAHCNFNLRGEESDNDEQFVVNFCQDLNVELFRKSFNTKEYAQEKGISIEMAARDLRYAWFNQILESKKLDWIATGHHRDDSIETFFLNLSRGTGIKGLSGIKPVYGNVIRPMLCFSRCEVEEYCNNNKLIYRTDSSNLETIYLRNKVRNQIIPLFKELNPSFMNTMEENMLHLGQISNFFQNYIEEIKEDVVVEQDEKLLISLKHIVNFIDIKLVLFELLHPYGFNGAVINELVDCIEREVSGKQFYSENYRIIKDRFNLILLPKVEKHNIETFYINIDDNELVDPIRLKLKNNIESIGYKIDTRKQIAQFDSDLLDFPLTIRKWHQGDFFKPLGMSNFKKLSDFFIDNKFSINDKEEVWLLLSGEDIIWIIGHRTDDRYKITKNTKKITKIELMK